MLFAIIDIETTGGDPKRNRITEIAILLHDGAKVIRTFGSLVNPETRIEPFVSRMTGITNQMVENAPKFYEIAKTIVEITEGAVFVAHNVKFDYQFIRREFQLLGFTYTRKQLCTVQLSRKLFPALSSHGLDRVSRHLNIHIQNRHRAMDDALAALKIFEIALEQDHQHQQLGLIVQSIQFAKLPPNISQAKIEELPETCGVYFYHDQDGEVIYVGKSVNIRKRVVQHIGTATVKENKMHTAVHNFSYEITGSELVAQLYESHLIKKLKPVFNHAQRNETFPFCICQLPLSAEHGYLEFAVAPTDDENLNVLAAFSKKTTAENILRNALKKFSLCEKYCGFPSGVGACFKRQMHECAGACAGEETAAAYNLRAAAAARWLQQSLAGNLIILENGRTYDERAVVLVQNGVYQGFGYVDAAISITPYSVADHIRHYDHNPEVIRIINQHLFKSKKKQVISF